MVKLSLCLIIFILAFMQCTDNITTTITSFVLKRLLRDYYANVLRTCYNECSRLLAVRLFSLNPSSSWSWHPAQLQTTMLLYSRSRDKVLHVVTFQRKIRDCSQSIGLSVVVTRPCICMLLLFFCSCLLFWGGRSWISININITYDLTLACTDTYLLNDSSAFFFSEVDLV